MKYFELTFRFDDRNQSLSRFEGFSIQELAEFLKMLSKAVSDNNQLVLSEVKGNCYAPVISTPIATEYEELKSLHTEISNGNYEGLNKNEQTYYRYLSGILGEGKSLKVYDSEKQYYTNIETLPSKQSHPYFYSTTQIEGVLTQIGSRTLNSMNTIFVDTYPIEIRINQTQEDQLKDHYKRTRLIFNITERIKKETGRAEQAELDYFTPVKELSFYESIDRVRNKYGDYFSDS